MSTSQHVLNLKVPERGLTLFRFAPCQTTNVSRRIFIHRVLSKLHTFEIQTIAKLLIANLGCINWPIHWSEFQLAAMYWHRFPLTYPSYLPVSSNIIGFIKRQSDSLWFTGLLCGVMGNWTWQMFGYRLVSLFPGTAGRVRSEFKFCGEGSVGVQSPRIICTELLLCWLTMAKLLQVKSEAYTCHYPWRPTKTKNFQFYGQWRMKCR